ncbi:MAG: hypothetical protein KC776_10705 [Myxococcales bacterium]|nr:hypothetical protein [Myxococcales bacterium]
MRASIVALGAGVWLLAAPAFADPVSSVSQYGVTWTFAQPCESGQFASGDYWVVGPCEITSVSPAPTGTRNGSAVNPKGGHQGYDDRGGEFDTAENVSFPYTLKVDESLVSSVSKAEGAEIKNVGCLQSQAVLTAVSAALPATALRPSYAGTFKQYLDTGNIHWDLLPKLPPPSNAPDGADLRKMAERPRIDHMNSWTIQNSCAEDNWYNGAGAHNCYGREYSTFISNAAMYTMLDEPDRDELVVSMIQLGIDNYGVLEAGGGWSPNGGHHSGRKWPIVFAGRLLDDCDLLKVGEKFDDSHFGEDGQTYAGNSGKALFGWDCGGGQGSYFESGCSGGGAKDCRDPAGMVDGCPDYRNCCTSGYWVGQMLSTLMLHAETIWNHQPYFDYVDRWMTGDVDGGGSASSAFIEGMWTQYRNDLPPGSPASTVCGAGGSGGGAGASSGGGAGTGAGGSASGGASSGGTSSGGTSNGAADSSDDGGCGCRTAPSPATSLAGLLLAAGAALSALRRRRR